MPILSESADQSAGKDKAEDEVCCMYMPRIDEEKCKVCGECVDVCPVDVFEIDEKEARVANPADCIGCESCISVCHEEAVTILEI